MPTYVPQSTIVREPIIQFRKGFGSDTPMGNREMDLGEYVRIALEGNLEFYRGIIAQSPGYGFYAKAPLTPHWVITLNGERKYLKEMEDIRFFYQTLPEAERGYLKDTAIGDLLKS